MHIQRDLTQGPILKQLTVLALPIMGMSFMQMAYNLTDMIWIGMTGSGALAAIGTAGFITWFGFAMLISTKIGVEVTVSQALGRKDMQDASDCSDTGYSIAMIISSSFAALSLLAAPLIIGLFNLGIDENGFDVSSAAVIYLRLVAFGMPFSYTNQTISGVYNGYGNTKKPFMIHGIGLIVNCLLDPLLIFGLGPIPAMGVAGAAIATVIAQIIVFFVFIADLKKMKYHLQFSWTVLTKNLSVVKKLMKIGLPPAVQSMLFASFAMGLARILSEWGSTPIAVQKVGAQIEALSWMTASGFATALSTFIGQNYGAGNYKRIVSGYATAMKIMTVLGLTATAILLFLSEPVFKIFLREPSVVPQGIAYLQILAVSQLFMCIEITTAGAFNGIGKSIPPAIISILFTGLRIPAALLLAYSFHMGVNGVWWSISLSSVIKGTLLVAWFTYYMKKRMTIHAFQA